MTTIASNPTGGRPELAVEYDELGRPVRVVIDNTDVTSLVARVQSVTDYTGTKHEVVLSINVPPPVFRQ